MKNIFYWRSIRGEKSVLEAYRVVIDKLLSGEYQAADLDLKRSKRYKIYSVRVNHSDRLLFTTIERGGFPCLLLLEVVPSHDYQKARYLSSPALKMRLERLKCEEQSKQAEADEFIDVTKDDEQDIQSATARTNQSVMPEPLNYYADNFIVFNDIQNAGLKKNLPLVISGVPGSGKSSLAAANIAQILENKPDDMDLPVLYVTKELFLANRMLEILRDDGVDLRYVLCYTYQQLSNGALPQITEKQKNQWVKDYANKYNSHNRIKAKSNKKSNTSEVCLHPTDPQRIIPEFRLLSGCIDKADYKAIGQKNTKFTVQERDILWETFQEYLLFLKTQQIQDPDFACISLKQRIYKVVVDESQEFTPFMLKQLYFLPTVPGQIIYCIDTQQVSLKQFPTRPFLLQLVGGDERHIKLSKTFRCPQKVIDVANKFIKMRNILACGIADKHEYTSIETSDDVTELGEVSWINLEEAIKYDTAYSNSVAFAIVTPKEFIEEARALFKTLLVFTVDQIRGGEYEYIQTYKLFSADYGPQINRMVHASGVDFETASAPVHRSKDGASDLELLAYFGQGVVGLTRTRKSLFLCEEVTEQNKHIIEVLNPKPKAHSNNNNNNNNQVQAPIKADIPKIEPLASNKEDWLNLATVLEKNKDTEVLAQTIRAKHLNTNAPSKGSASTNKPSSSSSSATVSKARDPQTRKQLAELNALKTQIESTANKFKKTLTKDFHLKIMASQFIEAVINNDSIGAIKALNTPDLVLRKKIVSYLHDGERANEKTNALNQAVIKGFDKIIELILHVLGSEEEKMDAMNTIYTNMSAFEFAVHTKNIGPLKILLNSLSKMENKLALFLNVPTERGLNNFLLAIACNKPNVVKTMLDSLSVPLRQNLCLTQSCVEWENALFLACETASLELVQLIFDAFTDEAEKRKAILSTNINGNNALHAAVQSKNPESFALLISAFPDEESLKDALIRENFEGNTALHLASEFGCTKITSEIVKACTNPKYVAEIISQTNDNEMTALMVAAKTGNYDSIPFILEQIPDFFKQYDAVHQKNSEEESAYTLAIANKNKFKETHSYISYVFERFQSSLTEPAWVNNNQYGYSPRLFTRNDAQDIITRHYAETILSNIISTTTWRVSPTFEASAILEIGSENAAKKVVINLNASSIGMFQLKPNPDSKNTYELYCPKLNIQGLLTFDARMRDLLSQQKQKI